MTSRDPHNNSLLTSEEIELIRGALAACSRLLRWAERRDGAALAEATRAVYGGRTPGHLRYDVSLAIDYLDFAPAAGSRR